MVPDPSAALRELRPQLTNGVASKPPSIFISYRRSDTADAAGRIFDQLENSFGRDRVFKDVDSLPLGVNFRHYIAEVIERSEIFLLLIGPRWTDPEGSGRCRLWDPEDLVRIEIETALTKRILVIPTLVSGAHVPARGTLPPSIEAILNVNAAVVRQDPDFRKDMSRLIVHLETLSDRQEQQHHRPRDPPIVVEARPKGRNATSPPRVAVVGIGGTGGGVINHMVAAKVRGVDFVAMNTDAQALNHSLAKKTVQLGMKVTQGLGAGSRPEIGAAAAEESSKEIASLLAGYDLIFLVAGMGGGTGSGATQVIAGIAHDLAKVVVGFVTEPFSFEGLRRKRAADKAIAALAPELDAIAVLPNQNLFLFASSSTTFKQVFEMTANTVASTIQSVVDVAISPGPLQLDFEDLMEFFDGLGRTKVALASTTSTADIDGLADRLLDFAFMGGSDVSGATNAILTVSGGRALSLLDVERVAQVVRAKLPAGARMLVGSAFDSSLADGLRVSLWANEPERNGLIG